MKFLIIPYVVTLLLPFSAIQAGSFEYSSIQTKAFEEIPLPIHMGGFDAANGCFGIISGELENRVFHLYNNGGEKIFDVESDPDFPLDIVRMRRYNGVVLLIGIYGEARYQFTAYDYFGNHLMGPIVERTDMEPSPTGNYYHCKNDYIFGMARPNIYDSQGRKLAELRPQSSFWELSAISDSLVLFQDGNTLNILSLPDLASVKKLTFNQGRPPMGSMKTAMSPDGTHYAILGADRIIICDIQEERFFHVDRKKDYIPEAMAISSKGEYLLVCEENRNGKTISLFKRGMERYIAMVRDEIVPLEVPVYSISGWSIFSEDACIINYSYGRKGSSHGHSIIFRLQDNKVPFSDHLVTWGPTVFNSKEKNLAIDVYNIDTNNSGLIKYRKVNIVEKHHE